MHKPIPHDGTNLSGHLADLIREYLQVDRVNECYDDSDDLIVVLSNGKRYVVTVARYKEYDYDVIGYEK